ncbi:amidase [Nocardia cyriacigeorgica]|uniref:amidase n=1 Tax=Nocardia cyriacigeorgica TaxID=135487 RepID=UPI002B4ACA70|nr:amidase [Nocardia cyriacigeorgica]
MRADEPLYAPWSLRDLVDDLDAGRTEAAAAWEQSAARIAATEDLVAAWVSRGPRPELPAPRGALGAIPVGVKDIIDVAGYPTRCGSALRASSDPVARDAEIVRLWRAAGALPSGKTVTTEFAYFAPGPTRNPAAPGRTPGGSSSGSAAAVAAGQVPLALGSQTAGSITRPAAYCGVAALVLTRGLLPTTGVTGLAPGLDSHGYFTGEVRDLACAWSALRGAPDPLASPFRPPRIAFWSASQLGVVEPVMAEAIAALRERMRLDGADVYDFASDHAITAATRAHSVIMAYEAARVCAGELGRAGALSAPLADLLRTGAATHRHDYNNARHTIDRSRQEILDTLSEYDAIVGPAAAGPAPDGLTATGDPVLSRAWQAFGLPVVTVPGLRTPDGIPLGVQVIGAPRSEGALLRTAAWIQERATLIRTLQMTANQRVRETPPLDDRSGGRRKESI